MTTSIRTLAAAGIVAAIGLIGTTAQAIEIDPRVVDYANHYVECKIWLLTDWPLHVKHCTPSHVVPEGKTLAPTGPGNVIVYIPPIDLPPILAR